MRDEICTTCRGMGVAGRCWWKNGWAVSAMAGILALALGLHAAPAAAELIAYESFSYTAGGDLNGKGPGDTGFTGTWGGDTDWDVASGSLSYPTGVTLSPAGNKASINGASGDGGEIEQSLSSSINFDADGTYFVSFLSNKTNNGTSSDYFWLKLMRNDTQKAAFGFTSREGVKVSLITDSPASPDGEIGTGDHFFLGKIVTAASGNDQIFMKSYGPSDTVPSSEPGSWSVTKAEAVTGVADVMNLVVGGNTIMDIDEFRLGTAYADVVPEPSTCVLLLTAGLALLVWLRRRRAA